jgi:histidinol-phosphatase
MADRALEQLHDFAVEIAWEAGRGTLSCFQAGVEAEQKGDGTPVTRADRDAEALLRRRIRERFPHDGLLGEEYGEEPGKSGRTWILDPIDGTKSFVHGVPLYSMLIGVAIEGVSRVGVIYLPALGEMCSAFHGGGCRLNGRRVGVRETASLAEATICSSDLPLDPAEPVHALFRGAKLRRTWGDGYGYLLVASGRADLMVDPRLSIWDLAALIPVIEEAGGVITDFEGRPGLEGKSAIAATPAVHREAIALLGEKQK